MVSTVLRGTGGDRPLLVLRHRQALGGGLPGRAAGNAVLRVEMARGLQLWSSPARPRHCPVARLSSPRHFSDSSDAGLVVEA